MAGKTVTTDSTRVLGELESFISRQVYRDRVTPRSLGLIGALVQLIDNSNDWGASHIPINVLEVDIEIGDDGVGQNRPRRKSYVGLGESQARGNALMKGDHGTGRMLSFGLCEKIRVDTVSEDDLSEGLISSDEVIRFGFTANQLEDALWGGDPIQEFAIPRSASKLSFRVGTRITLQNIFPKKRVADETIREQLGNFLSPRVARKITVNGKPLLERKLIGDEIHMDFPGLPLLGDLNVDLFIPEERQREDLSQDRLMLGAMGPVMNFKDFVSGMPPSLRKRVPKELLFGMVCGDFDAPYLNRYSTDQRNDFTADIYDDPALEVLMNTLELEVLPEIRARIGTPDNGNETAMFEKDLEAVRDDFSEAFGDATVRRTERKRVKVVFGINIRRITMQCGTSQRFRITKDGGTSGQFDWDTSESGGILDQTTGKEVLYTAGDEAGHFKLFVSDVSAPDRRAEIRITLVKEFEFSITPPRVTLAPGESVNIHARHVAKTSGKLDWKADKSGGSINAPEGNSVTYTAGQIVGSFELVVFDHKDPRKNATCYITIDVRTTHDEEAQMDLIAVGDPDHGDTRLYFEVFPVIASTTPRTFFFARGEKKCTLNMNYAHPIFTRAKSISERRAQFKRAVVDAYAAIVFEGMTGDRLFQERDRILQALLTSKKPKTDAPSA